MSKKFNFNGSGNFIFNVQNQNLISKIEYVERDIFIKEFSL